ncbi:MAG: HupE/UreJ family protein [Gloeotrichia echinulata HAB0833]
MRNSCVSFAEDVGRINYQKTNDSKSMLKIELSGASTSVQQRHIGAIAALVLISLLSSLSGLPVNHAISNWSEGLLWGMAEPVIRLDHLASLVAIGLISGRTVHGALMAATFVLATVFGTIIHLFPLSLAGAEIAIAASTIIFGAMLVTSNLPNWVALTVIGAIAGLFHGYADGDGIIGTGIIPLVAYVLGVTLTQYVVAMSAREIKPLLSSKIRFTGLAFCALGIMFLSYSIKYSY